jgi:hypothetical protein
MRQLYCLAIIASFMSGCDRPRANADPPQTPEICPSRPDRDVLLGTDWSDPDKDEWIAEHMASQRLCIASH